MGAGRERVEAPGLRRRAAQPGPPKAGSRTCPALCKMVSMFLRVALTLLGLAFAVAIAGCGDGNGNDGPSPEGPDGTALPTLPLGTATTGTPGVSLDDTPVGGTDGTQPGGATPATGGTPTGPNPVAEAREALLEETGGDPEDVDVLSIAPMTWPDACLGLAEQGEACAQVLTAGFRVVLVLGDSRYVYRTDETGTNIRLERVDNFSE